MLCLSTWDWTLFLSALVSSTLSPGGSEAVLLYHLQEPESNTYLLIFIATLGNVCGSVITYAMGRYGFQFSHRWFQISDTKIKRAKQHFQRWGTPALLFAWLPILGDPLCLVAGSLRYSLLSFITLVSIGKLARYTLIASPFM